MYLESFARRFRRVVAVLFAAFIGCVVGFFFGLALVFAVEIAVATFSPTDSGAGYGDPMFLSLDVLFVFGCAMLGLVLAPLMTLRAMDKGDRPPPGHCQLCGYNLTGLTEHRCPECGNPFEPDGPKA